MIVERINETHNANIYGVYENNYKPVGTVQVILTGPQCGAHAYTLTYKYTAKQILSFYKQSTKAH